MSDQTEQLEKELAFAAIGKQVTDNEAYKEAFAIRTAQLFDAFCNTKKDQEDVREEAWRTMQNLNALKSYFDTILQTGKLAEAGIKQQEAFKESQT